MNNDVRKIILGTLVGFLGLLTVWVGFLFLAACGGSLACSKAQPTPDRTSIPTLIPASLPTPPLNVAHGMSLKCHVGAISLLEAWINSGYPETDPFEFQDVNGTVCTATYAADVSFLFKEANLWYSGALPCISCHNTDVAKASAQMSLSDYQGILAGSRRTAPDVKGNDILGGGVWEKSKLYDVMIARKGQPLAMPFGRPADLDVTKVLVNAGSVKAGGAEAATPSPAEVARPSNPGGPGEAVNLTGDPAAGLTVYTAMCAVCHGTEGKQGIDNPGSEDGTVPPLNPIDSTLIDADYKTYATNIDLFIEHGSTPAGDAPAKVMPAWGDQKTITQQQIADVIAYIISLNPVPEPPVEVAHPSNPGGPGDAVNLTGDPVAGLAVYTADCTVCHGVEGKQGIDNPGSEDGTVPPLNPIDSTLIDADYKTYATNVDLFIEHGSTPAGSAPAKVMPAWGEQKTLTQQQIADVIAYIISLNPAPEPPAEVARPSNPGGPGEAVNLTGDPAAGLVVYTADCAVCHGAEGKLGIDNPGSEDGTVPPLNPIDSTLIDADYKTYATNIDLFIEHGSTPAGDAPAKLMPAWGEQKTMTPQQIADAIAYIISLNK